ncbi:MAG: glutamyl-tRNA ligase [Alphaproteobacteria bacterium]|jgi:glutamyl-tRNA synthetase|nr:glutamyl-tRNA ligase [Alphaproteobacteria bacterium]
MVIITMAIRVRFAPSPTGLLHIGNARTALINWLFARHHALKGEDATFLLRLDDTDLERSDPLYAKAIEEDLAWLGLTHDQFARQSDRFDQYDQAVARLKATGRLYPCYETPEELDFKRKRQLARHEPPIYDRTALKLTDEERRAFEAEGRQPHWRFKLLPEAIHWDDLIRGPNDFHGSHLSDPVLVRADGAYLYTLTSVVDDIDLGITHIIRGEDHVTNTAVQIQLFAALGGDVTHLHFAHSTLLVDVNGASLSKRLGSLSLATLRESGLEPMAINSLLARLGTSLPVEPQLTLDELAQNFTLSALGRASPRFDPAELETLNHKLLQVMPYDQVQGRLREIAPSLTEAFWNVIRGNLRTLEEACQWEAIYVGHITPLIEDRDYLGQALGCLPGEPWDTATWGLWTARLKEITGRKGKALFMPLRQAITGMDHGPEMKELLPLIGYGKVVERLKG